MRFKTKLVNTLLLNIFTAATLCLTAQLLTIAQGNLEHFVPAMFGLNFCVAYPVACIVGLFVPAVEFAQAVCIKLGVKPGPVYFVVLTLAINLIYTLILSTVMTWFNLVFLNGQGFSAFFFGLISSFIPMWLASSLVSGLITDPIMKLAFKLTGEKMEKLR